MPIGDLLYSLLGLSSETAWEAAAEMIPGISAPMKVTPPHRGHLL